MQQAKLPCSNLHDESLTQHSHIMSVGYLVGGLHSGWEFSRRERALWLKWKVQLRSGFCGFFEA
jgi:hypothetical protein